MDCLYRIIFDYINVRKYNWGLKFKQIRIRDSFGLSRYEIEVLRKIKGYEGFQQ